MVIGGERIVALVPLADLPKTLPTHDLPDGAWLAPGFIDIQVNGGGDVLFNDDPSPDTIWTIVAAHRRFGTTALLPTLISDNTAKLGAALAAVDEIAATEPAVLGIHLEGPYISPGKVGVHDPRAIRLPTANELTMITAKRHGVTLLTLAPEQVSAGVISRLTAAGVQVALGHSMATYAQTIAAMAEGLVGFTHLFNAMRPL